MRQCCTIMIHMDLERTRPSPLPPIPFFKSPPKKSEWRGAARREGGTRGTPRVAGFSIGTQSERTRQFQATTHAERAKSLALEKGSRKGYDYTAIFRKGFLNQKYGRHEVPSVLNSPQKVLNPKGFATQSVAQKVRFDL